MGNGTGICSAAVRRGAATNPDPDVFMYAAAQVKHCLDATHRLGGANYVLWGGREGYETLLNTDMARELDQLGQFLNLVVQHKHDIGFTGTILIEPKPQEPTKHQYDYDSATVYGFLQRTASKNEIKVNIEVNHATLGGHDFNHEVAVAIGSGIFGSVDANRGDDRLGWDTDQFPNSVEQMSLGIYEILKGGGFTTGGFMFDTKLRRQSLARDDLFHGHIGAMDTMARSLLVAASLIEDGELAAMVEDRYAAWGTDLGQKLACGRAVAGRSPRPGACRRHQPCGQEWAPRADRESREPHDRTGPRRPGSPTPSGDRCLDHRPGLGVVTPVIDSHPFVGLEVLVVGEEVLDLLAGDRRQIREARDRFVALRNRP